MATMNQYFPQSIPHPCEILVEKLQEIGMGPKEFAVRTGKPEKTITAVLKGDSAITPEMAILFENVLMIPARFWLENQRDYDEYIARTRRVTAIEEALEWAKNFPYVQMAKYGWLASTRKAEEKVVELFHFFGLSSKSAWENYYLGQKLKLSFRISLKHTSEPYAVSAWLRQGDIIASKLPAGGFDEKKFMTNLRLIKTLMAEQPPDFFPKLQTLCAEAGVKVVYTPCLPKAPISGSSRWLNDTPLIQLSARYGQNDRFWFTFFHEAGHILLHGKKYISLENIDFTEVEADKEKEADGFSESWTFSLQQEKEVLAAIPMTVENIIAFAKKFNTHPAMIIGRFQHKKLLPYNMGREFIVPVNFSNEECE
ncbi:MAG: ImmA/IrrE family metallo-endopeptidase [Bacteroidota bacterium]